MSARQLGVLAVVVVALLISLDSYFIVNEINKAVLKRVGRIERTDIEPGIYAKWPIIDKVIKVDGRILVHDVPTERIPTIEKKLLNVDFFVIWRIADVQRYVTVIGGGLSRSTEIQRRAEDRLGGRVVQALRDEFGKRTVQEVVASEREKVMDQVAAVVNAETMEQLGIQVIDIRVKQVDWPDEVRGRVFDRMRAERARDAAEHRAEGRERAERIRAEADRQRTVLLAEAYRDSQKFRGQGDALAASIYARAYGRDPEFFRFYRSLQAYRDSLNSKDDVLVLDPDSDFFRYLNSSRVLKSGS